MLGGLLGAMLIGLSVLITREHVAPAVGRGAGPARRRVVRHRPGVVRDQYCRHPTAGVGGQHQLRRAAGTDEPAVGRQPAPPPGRLRAERPVQPYGVVALAVLAGVLLIAVTAGTDGLIDR